MVDYVETALLAILWLVLGTVITAILVKIYDAIIFRHIDLKTAIAEGNRAVSIFFSLMFLGIIIVIFASVLSPAAETLAADIGEMIGWSIGISALGTVLFFGLDKLLIPNIKLEKAMQDNNIAAGILAGVIYLGVALIGASVIMS